MGVQRFKKLNKHFHFNKLFKFILIVPAVEVFIMSMKGSEHSTQAFATGEFNVTNSGFLRDNDYLR